MKHIKFKSTHANRIFAQPLASGLFFLLVLSHMACKKQVEQQSKVNRSISKKMNESSQGLLTSIDFQWANHPSSGRFNLLSASYDNRRMSGTVNFMMVDGSVRTIRNYTYDQMGRLARTDVQGEGHTEYDYRGSEKTARSGSTYDPYRTFKFRVIYNTNSNDGSLTADRYDNQEKHVERMVLQYDSRGVPNLVSYYKPNENGAMQLMGSKKMFTTASADQINSWRYTAGKFPEPVCPSMIQMLICDRVEMHGNYISASGEDTIADRRVIYIDRSSLNTNDLRGKLLRITVKDGDISPAPPYDLFLNYSK